MRRSRPWRGWAVIDTLHANAPAADVPQPARGCGGDLTRSADQRGADDRRALFRLVGHQRAGAVLVRKSPDWRLHVRAAAAASAPDAKARLLAQRTGSASRSTVKPVMSDSWRVRRDGVRLHVRARHLRRRDRADTCTRTSRTPEWRFRGSRSDRGVLAIAALLGVELVVDLIHDPHAQLRGLRDYVQSRMGRVIVLHLAIIFGMMAMALSNSPLGVLYVLIALKTRRGPPRRERGAREARERGHAAAGWSMKRRHARQGQGHADDVPSSGRPIASTPGRTRSRTSSRCPRAT